MLGKHRLRRDMFQKSRALRPVANTTGGRLRKPYRSPGDDGRAGARGPGRLLAVLGGGRDQPMCLRASRRVSFEREASCDATKRPTPAGSTRA